VLGKHTLGPKEKTLLRITFDTKGSPGSFRKTVTVSTDIPGQEELEVTIEGIVRESPAAKIRVAPRRVDLGVVNPGRVKTGPLSITNPGSLPLVITKIYVKDTRDLLHDGERQGDLVILPGETRSFECAIRADKGRGDYQEVIVIESNAKNAPKGGYVIIVRYRGS
jgi:uncharacterized membrane protein